MADFSQLPATSGGGQPQQQQRQPQAQQQQPPQAQKQQQQKKTKARQQQKETQARQQQQQVEVAQAQKQQQLQQSEAGQQQQPQQTEAQQQKQQAQQQQQQQTTQQQQQDPARAQHQEPQLDPNKQQQHKPQQAEAQQQEQPQQQQQKPQQAEAQQQKQLQQGQKHETEVQKQQQQPQQADAQQQQQQQVQQQQQQVQQQHAEAHQHQQPQQQTQQTEAQQETQQLHQDKSQQQERKQQQLQQTAAPHEQQQKLQPPEASQQQQQQPQQAESHQQPQKQQETQHAEARQQQPEQAEAPQQQSEAQQQQPQRAAAQEQAGAQQQQQQQAEVVQQPQNHVETPNQGQHEPQQTKASAQQELQQADVQQQPKLVEAGEQQQPPPQEPANGRSQQQPAEKQQQAQQQEAQTEPQEAATHQQEPAAEQPQQQEPPPEQQPAGVPNEKQQPDGQQQTPTEQPQQQQQEELQHNADKLQQRVTQEQQQQQQQQAQQQTQHPELQPKAQQEQRAEQPQQQPELQLQQTRGDQQQQTEQQQGQQAPQQEPSEHQKKQQQLEAKQPEEQQQPEEEKQAEEQKQAEEPSAAASKAEQHQHEPQPKEKQPQQEQLQEEKRQQEDQQEDELQQWQALDEVNAETSTTQPPPQEEAEPQAERQQHLKEPEQEQHEPQHEHEAQQEQQSKQKPAEKKVVLSHQFPYQQQAKSPHEALQQHYQQKEMRLVSFAAATSWGAESLADLVALQQQGMLQLTVPPCSSCSVRTAETPAAAANPNGATGREEACASATGFEKPPASALLRSIAAVDEALQVEQRTKPPQQKQIQQDVDSSAVTRAHVRLMLQALLLLQQRQQSSSSSEMWLQLELPEPLISSTERHQRRCALRYTRKQQQKQVEREAKRIALLEEKTKEQELHLLHQLQQQQQQQQHKANPILRVALSAVEGLSESTARHAVLQASKSAPLIQKEQRQESSKKTLSIMGSLHLTRGGKSSSTVGEKGSETAAVAAKAAAEGAKGAFQGARRLLGSASKAMSRSASSLAGAVANRRQSSAQQKKQQQRSVSQTLTLPDPAMAAEAAAAAVKAKATKVEVNTLSKDMALLLSESGEEHMHVAASSAPVNKTNLHHLLQCFVTLLQLHWCGKLRGFEATGDIRTEAVWGAVCEAANERITQLRTTLQQHHVEAAAAAGADGSSVPVARTEPEIKLMSHQHQEKQKERLLRARQLLAVRRVLLPLRQVADDVAAPLLPVRVDQNVSDGDSDEAETATINEKCIVADAAEKTAAAAAEAPKALGRMEKREEQKQQTELADLLLAALAVVETLIRGQETLKFVNLGASVLELLAQTPDLLLTDWRCCSVSKQQRRVLLLLANSRGLLPEKQQKQQQDEEAEEVQRVQPLLQLRSLEVLVLNKPPGSAARSRLFSSYFQDNYSSMTFSSSRSSSCDGLSFDSDAAAADPKLAAAAGWTQACCISAEEGVPQLPLATEELQWRWHYKLAKGQLGSDGSIASFTRQPKDSVMQQEEAKQEEPERFSGRRDVPEVLTGLRGGNLGCFAVAVAARPVVLAAFLSQVDDLHPMLKLIGDLSTPYTFQQQRQQQEVDEQQQQKQHASNTVKSLHICNTTGRNLKVSRHAGQAVAEFALVKAKKCKGRPTVAAAFAAALRAEVKRKAQEGVTQPASPDFPLFSRRCKGSLHETQAQVLPELIRLHLKRCSLLLPLMVCPSLQQLLLQQATVHIDLLLLTLESCSDTLRQLYVHHVKGVATPPMLPSPDPIESGSAEVEGDEFPATFLPLSSSPATEEIAKQGTADGAAAAVDSDVDPAKSYFSSTGAGSSRPLLLLPKLQQYGGTARLFCQSAGGFLFPALKRLSLRDTRRWLGEGEQQHRFCASEETPGGAAAAASADEETEIAKHARESCSRRAVEAKLLRTFLETHVPSLDILATDIPFAIPSSSTVGHYKVQHLAFGLNISGRGFHDEAKERRQQYATGEEVSSDNMSPSDTEQETPEVVVPPPASEALPFVVSHIADSTNVPFLVSLAITGCVTVDALMRLTGSPPPQNTDSKAHPILFMFLGAIVSLLQDVPHRSSASNSKETPEPAVSSKTIVTLLQRCPSVQVFGLQQLPQGVHLQVLDTRLKHTGFVRADKRFIAALLLYESGPYNKWPHSQPVSGLQGHTPGPSLFVEHKCSPQEGGWQYTPVPQQQQQQQQQQQPERANKRTVPVNVGVEPGTETLTAAAAAAVPSPEPAAAVDTAAPSAVPAAAEPNDFAQRSSFSFESAAAGVGAAFAAVAASVWSGTQPPASAPQEPPPTGPAVVEVVLPTQAPVGAPVGEVAALAADSQKPLVAASAAGVAPARTTTGSTLAAADAFPAVETATAAAAEATATAASETTAAAAAVRAAAPADSRTPAVPSGSADSSSLDQEDKFVPELRALRLAAASLASPDIIELKKPHYAAVRERLQREIAVRWSEETTGPHGKPAGIGATGRASGLQLQEAGLSAVYRMLGKWKHVFVRASPEGLRCLGGN